MNNELWGISGSWDSKKPIIQCVPHEQQVYHIKNNHGQEPTCLATKQKSGKAHRVITFSCDSNHPGMYWLKRVSHHGSLINGAFQICRGLDKTLCLSIDAKNFENGNHIVNVDSYSDNGSELEFYQQWRQNPKTNQLVNVKNGMCLTSFDTFDSVSFLSVGVETCTRGPNITVQQKWTFDQLPKCPSQSQRKINI